MDPICIRRLPAYDLTYCGKQSKDVGSISIQHSILNPANHLERLNMCTECVRLSYTRIQDAKDAEDGGRYGRME